MSFSFTHSCSASDCKLLLVIRQYSITQVLLLASAADKTPCMCQMCSRPCFLALGLAAQSRARQPPTHQQLWLDVGWLSMSHAIVCSSYVSTVAHKWASHPNNRILKQNHQRISLEDDQVLHSCPLSLTNSHNWRAAGNAENIRSNKSLSAHNAGRFCIADVLFQYFSTYTFKGILISALILKMTLYYSNLTFMLMPQHSSLILNCFMVEEMFVLFG